MRSEKDVAVHKVKARFVASVDTAADIHTYPEEAVVAAVRKYFDHVDRGLKEMLLTRANSTVGCDIWAGMADLCVLLPSGQAYLSRSC